MKVLKGMIDNHSITEERNEGKLSRSVLKPSGRSDSPAQGDSGCGHRRRDLSLSDRVYHCTNPECLLVIDRDVNAALNILALGLQRLGLRPIEAASLAC
jgi:hypothetical protein